MYKMVRINEGGVGIFGFADLAKFWFSYLKIVVFLLKNRGST